MGNWKLWLLMGGRGIGKTDTMAHFVNQHVLGPPCDKRIPGGHRVGIVAPTLGDAVKACVNGPSGLKAHNPGVRMVQGVGGAQVYWPNGAEAALFSTEDARTVDRLRAGGNRCLDWWEELAAWPMLDDGWEQAVYGLRIGPHPRAVASTTPKNRKKLKDLLAEPDTVMRHATTRDNPHLSEEFRTWLVNKFEGTRSGRQELEGELLDDVPDALWQRAAIDATRIKEVPEMKRVVVAIDPAVTSGEDSDETGIVVAGIGVDGRGYVLADRTCRMSPDGWAKRATIAYDQFQADRIIAEVNNGGDLVERVLRTAGKNYPYRAVRASRGKATRAEPISALYEQGRISHVGAFPELEDQMCLVSGTKITTRNGEIPIYLVQRGHEVWTRDGWKRVTWAGMTGTKRVVSLTTRCGQVLRATPDHPVYVQARGFVPLGEVQKGDNLFTCRSQSSSPTLNSKASGTSWTDATAITKHLAAADDCSCTERYGRASTGAFRQVGTSTTSTTSAGTMRLETSWPYPQVSTNLSTDQRASHLKARPSSGIACSHGGDDDLIKSSSASIAGAMSLHEVCEPGSAACTVASVTGLSPAPELVYNLSVEDQPEFFANGLLVHNCSYTPDGYDGSPDRVDALVWALTDLMLTGRGWTAL